MERKKALNAERKSRTDFAWFKSVAYPRALAAVGPTNSAGDSTTYKQLTSTNIPQWVRDKGRDIQKTVDKNAKKHVFKTIYNHRYRL